MTVYVCIGIYSCVTLPEDSSAHSVTYPDKSINSRKVLKTCHRTRKEREREREAAPICLKYLPADKVFYLALAAKTEQFLCRWFSEKLHSCLLLQPRSGRETCGRFLLHVSTAHAHCTQTVVCQISYPPLLQHYQVKQGETFPKRLGRGRGLGCV